MDPLPPVPTDPTVLPDPAVIDGSGRDGPGPRNRLRRLPRPGPPDWPGRRPPILAISLVIVAVLAGGGLFMSGYSMGRQAGAEPGTPLNEDEAFRPFWDTYHTITDRYAGGEVNRDELVQGAVAGMIDALGDPYSSYLSIRQYRESLQGIGGEFEGIGAQLSSRASDGTAGCTPLGSTCQLLIVAPLAGSPAMQADLRPGDVVLAADGVSFEGLTVDAALDRIRGPKGTVVTLHVRRGVRDDLALRITRDVIQQEEVTSRELDGGRVGYVRLIGFSDRGAAELETALAAHLEAGRTKLILDLRGNPGGYVTAAREVASQFIGSGVLFWEQDADGGQTPTEARSGGVATDPAIEVVCLIDGGSASASEIVAGALQDSGRARIVGQPSFGKGTVQQWQELTGEGGAFRLTVARWLTPHKRWIHGTGLIPDVAVSLPVTMPAGEDPTLDRAVELLTGQASSGAGRQMAARSERLAA